MDRVHRAPQAHDIAAPRTPSVKNPAASLKPQAGLRLRRAGDGVYRLSQVPVHSSSLTNHRPGPVTKSDGLGAKLCNARRWVLTGWKHLERGMSGGNGPDLV